MDASIYGSPVTRINPGAFTKAAIGNDAGEVELSLSRHGNWVVHIRRPGEAEWRIACNGDMEAGILTIAPSDRSGEINFGALRLLRGPRRVFVGDREADLSQKEFELLLVLISDPYRLFTKEELMRSVWGYVPATSTNSVKNSATRLRCKLAAAGAEGLVVNQWGKGYRLSDGPPSGPSGVRPGGHLAAA